MKVRCAIRLLRGILWLTNAYVELAIIIVFAQQGPVSLKITVA
jgi:hypothetical protein